MKKSDLAIVLLIFVVSAITLRDLFRGQFYTSHDGIHNVVRLYYFDQSLRDGQLPPRWAGGLLNGFGYPLFIFSFHMPWIIAEPFYFLGLSIFDSIKITFILTFALSGIAMYLFQKDLFGRFPSLVGTTLYLFAPYRFSNIFVRSAIGDATTFVFAPLAFWGIYVLREKFSWKWISISSFGIAGLVLSHAMVFLLFFVPWLFYILFSLFIQTKRKDFLQASFLTVLFGFGLSAYYTIPSIAERGNTQFQALMKGIFLGSYFPNLSELLYSRWAYGVFHAEEGAMSPQLGLAQLIAVVFTFLVAVFYVFKWKKVKKTERSSLLEGAFFLSVFLFSLILMLSVSRPLWELVSKIVLIDFPWRFLAVSTFAASVCAGFLITQLTKFKFIIALSLVALALYANRNHLRINQSLNWDLSFYLQLEKTTNTYDEYTPRWVRKELVEEKKAKVEFSGESAKINILANKSNRLEFDIEALEGGIATINTVYYPGWQVYINGQKQTINYQDNGLIRVPVSYGKQRVLAVFSKTPLRKLSNILTLATFGILLVGLVRHKLLQISAK